MNMIGISGGFVGPYWMGIAKDHTGNNQRGLVTMAVPMLIGAAPGKTSCFLGSLVAQ
jgi:MFS transporter, ACS family, tartrate transporter